MLHFLWRYSWGAVETLKWPPARALAVAVFNRLDAMMDGRKGNSR